MRTLRVSLLLALGAHGCLGPFSDKEWYCRGAAEGVPSEMAREVYEYCRRTGYREHLREERKCKRAALDCCSTYCQAIKSEGRTESNDQLQRCGLQHKCTVVLVSDCGCL